MPAEFDTVQMKNLLIKWRAGDPVARNELLRASLNRLEKLARRMLRDFPIVRNNEQTGDILSRSVLRLMRSLGEVEFQSTADFFGLATTHIRRELLDLARFYRGTRVGGKVGIGSLNAADEDGPSIDPAAPPTDELDRWTALHAAVEKLPAEERETFSLRFYHGWTHAQIAELFGVGERTIRRRWVDACRLLGQELIDELPVP